MAALPADAALVRAVAPEAAWSPTEELLATIAELLDHGNRLFFAANAPKGTRPPEPIRIPRPGAPVRTRRRRPATSEELAAFFGRSITKEAKP